MILVYFQSFLQLALAGSFKGIVALTGVVVNDSLVMVDFINRYRSEGNSITNAVLEAGPRRFRPIFLTSKIPTHPCKKGPRSSLVLIRVNG